MKGQEPIAMFVVCASVLLPGALMMAAGLLSLLQAEQFPALAAPSLAWPLLAVGAMLDTGAVLQLWSVLNRKGRSA